MKKVKKFLLKNIKVIIAFIIGGIIVGTGVYATNTTMDSLLVGYDKTNSAANGATKDTVQEAIDELYSKAKHINTYTLTTSEVGTKDLGENHSYRYIDASNVYNQGKSDGKGFYYIASPTFSLISSSNSCVNFAYNSWITGYTEASAKFSNGIFTNGTNNNGVDFRLSVNPSTGLVTATFCQLKAIDGYVPNIYGLVLYNP